MTSRSQIFLILFATMALSACADMTVAKRAEERGDYATARTNLEDLAKFGLPDAQRQLGLLLISGQGGSADPVRGIKLLEEASANGQSKAALDLGKIYEKGGPVPQDLSKALQYYLMALDRGDTRATLQIGGCFESQKNKEKAIEWYQRALAEGNPKAAFRLGRLYERGKIVPADHTKALAYYYVAEKNGSPESKEAITRLEKTLEESKLAESKTLARRLSP